MTLIIGFQCADGVGLVSDTLITDTEAGTPLYGSKILTPLRNTAFIIGAAGYANLFNEFNRKIPLLADQRLAEHQIRNIDALIRSGLSRNEAIEYLSPRRQTVEQSEQPAPIDRSGVPPEQPHAEIVLPYFYNTEDFMDDCKSLIKSITERAELGTPYPLEVLIGLHRSNEERALLHHIDSQGNEEQIDRYYPIGSGSPYVRMFFDRLYDPTHTMLETIALAIFTIAYVRDIARDPYVGYTRTRPPEAVVVRHDEVYGLVEVANMEEVLNDAEQKARTFHDQVMGLSFPNIIERQAEESLSS